MGWFLSAPACRLSVSLLLSPCRFFLLLNSLIAEERQSLEKGAGLAGALGHIPQEVGGEMTGVPTLRSTLYRVK